MYKSFYLPVVSLLPRKNIEALELEDTSHYIRTCEVGKNWIYLKVQSLKYNNYNRKLLLCISYEF